MTKKEILSNFTDILRRAVENSELSISEKDALRKRLDTKEKIERSQHERLSLEWFSDDNDVVHLIPRCPRVDLLLNTTVLTTDEAVQFILPMVYAVIGRSFL